MYFNSFNHPNTLQGGTKNLGNLPKAALTQPRNSNLERRL